MLCRGTRRVADSSRLRRAVAAGAGVHEGRSWRSKADFHGVGIFWILGETAVFIVRGGWGFSDFDGKVIVVYGNSGGGGDSIVSAISRILLSQIPT